MKFNIEQLKKRKFIYAIDLNSKKPEIFKFIIKDIEIKSVMAYSQIIFTLTDNKRIWYATIYEKFINDESNHDINKPFTTFLTNKPKWEQVNYEMYNFMFGFSKFLLSKEYIKYINNLNKDLQNKMDDLNNEIDLNENKIKLIQK